MLELLQRPTCNLGIDVVSDLPCKRAFDWERFIQELFVEVLLLLSNKDTSDTAVIKLRSTCSSYHLEKISQREINISLQLGIIELRPFDDHEPCREVDTPCQSAGGHQHLDLLLDEQLFDNLPVALSKASMVHAHTELDGVSKVLILNKFTYLSDLFWVHEQEGLVELNHTS